MVHSTQDRGASCQEYPATDPLGWLPKPWGKGAVAEVIAVAGGWLAVWRISPLLSQKCGALSTNDPYRGVMRDGRIMLLSSFFVYRKER